ncbi:Ubiquitin-conjugating enzyme E2 32 [Asimina triloba]
MSENKPLIRKLVKERSAAALSLSLSLSSPLQFETNHSSCSLSSVFIYPRLPFCYHTPEGASALSYAMAEKYNLKNPAVKRILQEVKEMQSNPSEDFMSLPFEENIFEWQFAIRGPRDTEFEGGIYHGRIQLPAEYPFKPPAFMLLTPNVRTALVALIAFMPTNPDGALGSLDYKKEERRALAIKSREAAPKFGTPERQKLIDEIHQHMRGRAPPVPQLSPQPSVENTNDREGETHMIPEASTEAITAVVENHNPQPEPRVVEDVREVHMNANAGPLRVSFSAGLKVSRQAAAEAGPSEVQRASADVRVSLDDRLFTWAAMGLALAIVFLLVKKFLKASGYYMDEILQVERVLISEHSLASNSQAATFSFGDAGGFLQTHEASLDKIRTPKIQSCAKLPA